MTLFTYNWKYTEIKKFFKSLNLVYTPYLLFENNYYVNNELKNNINKHDKSLYSKLLCYNGKPFVKKPKLSIRYISNEIGYGLFAEQDFEEKDFVGEFCGTVTNSPPKESDKYNCSYKFESTLVIAPRKYGNEMQFANHSSVKNNVDWDNTNGDDEHIHIILIAIKKIKCGDEILVNYGESYWTQLGINPVE
ncbi:lysine methyltransferase [Bodo saltans virus]|uniref:Lysine methyltransferase n=1 Tax=Bodo saltans virus TaxID=2024608 RepID=A0A2H4UVV9_9VIRU|nr:lysine methyltransferase [Bodo saltans virus]ATZ81063.1 lysine methyltransferase [Bodo saltans virus]